MGSAALSRSVDGKVRPAALVAASMSCTGASETDVAVGLGEYVKVVYESPNPWSTQCCQTAVRLRAAKTGTVSVTKGTTALPVSAASHALVG